MEAVCCVCGAPGPAYVGTGGGFDYRACRRHEALIWASLDIDKGWPMTRPEGTYCDDKETFLAESFTIAVTAEVEQWEAHMGAVAAISDAFTQELQAYLTPADLEAARARNAAEQNPTVCHTHDFCDANVYMASAFHACGYLNAIDYKSAIYDVLLAEDNCPVDRADELSELTLTNGEADRLTRIWNDAWNLSKARAFETHKLVA